MRWWCNASHIFSHVEGLVMVKTPEIINLDYDFYYYVSI